MAAWGIHSAISVVHELLGTSPSPLSDPYPVTYAVLSLDVPSGPVGTAYCSVNTAVPVGGVAATAVDESATSGFMMRKAVRSVELGLRWYVLTVLR